MGTYGGGVLRMVRGAGWNPSPICAAIEINPNAMTATDRAVYAGTLDRGLAVYNATSGRWNLGRADYRR